MMLSLVGVSDWDVLSMLWLILQLTWEGADVMDTVFALIQTLTFLALVLYVVKTWQIASAAAKQAQSSTAMVEEMRAGRAQENAPWVITYFDFQIPDAYVYVVIRNIGRGVAKNVTASFSPELQNTIKGDSSLSQFMAKSITVLPPSGEIKTFLDLSYHIMESKDCPKQYRASLTWENIDGSESFSQEYELDLVPYTHVTYIQTKTLKDLIGSIQKFEGYYKKTTDSLQTIAAGLERGIWVRNPVFQISTSPANDPPHLRSIITCVEQYLAEWQMVRQQPENWLWGHKVKDLQNWLSLTGTQLSLLHAGIQSTLDGEINGRITELSNGLRSLSNQRCLGDGGASQANFLALGDQLSSTAEELIQKLPLVEKSLSE